MQREAATAATILLLAACSGDKTTAPISPPDEGALLSSGSEPVLSVTGHVGSSGDAPDPSPFAVQHVSFVAQMNADGNVSGHVHSLVTFPTSGQHNSWTEDVDCLVVVENVAWMGTVVVHSTPGTLVPVGQRYVYRIIDNDKDDLAQRGPNLTDCTLQPPVGPLVESMQGDVQIHDRR
jgi:hypothetical protein